MNSLQTPLNWTVDAATAEEAPVDMDSMLQFTAGSPGDLRELITLCLSQTAEQLEQLKATVRVGDAAGVGWLAHRCAGSSSTCGMRRLAPLLRELERKGTEGELTGATQIWQDARVEFERVRVFLEQYLVGCSALGHPRCS